MISPLLRRLQALTFLLIAASAPAETITGKPDLEMIRRNDNFGYTEDEIQRLFSQSQVFEYDYTGFASLLVKAPPARGQHPRILFYKEDLPGLRKKLATSAPGKQVMDGIRATLAELITSPGAKYAKAYEDAVAGVDNPEIMTMAAACAIIYETFRSLIDDDAEGGRKAAAALTTLARLDGLALDAAFARDDEKNGTTPRLRDYQRYRGETQSGLLGLGYDFSYNQMDENQRTIVRSTLAKASAGMMAIGCEALPALPANTSNWIPMHMPMLLLVTAIEGEPGCDPATYKRFVDAYKRYLSVGFFPSGEMYESMGKNFLCAENLIPIGNRGSNLIALKQVRAQVSNYYLNAMDPWGGKFTFFDSLGGRGNTTPLQDVMIVKRMFPTDPAVDFVYRNVVGEDYSFYKEKVRFTHPLHLGSFLMRAVFSVCYDETKTYEQARQLATRDKSLTYYSEDTGNLITRTAWNQDATVMHYLTRSVAGGHVYADRSNFNLISHGRHWAIYKPMRQVEEHYLPRNRSVVLIDGTGPGYAMAKSVALEDKPSATFIVSDSKPCFDWTTGGNNRFPKGGQPVPFTGNDFRLRKSAKPWMDIPWSDLPNWQTSKKGSEHWLPHFPVQRAFRSAGLVRGKHPYAVIMDDYQKDGVEHLYDWGMILEDDVVPVASSLGSDHREMLLGEGSAEPGPRQLLVRVLDANGLMKPRALSVERYELPNPPMAPLTVNRLSMKAESVAPDFKVLLYPHIKGGELPETIWNEDRSRLEIRWSDQKDLLEFSKPADGRTRIRITRDHATLCELK